MCTFMFLPVKAAGIELDCDFFSPKSNYDYDLLPPYILSTLSVLTSFCLGTLRSCPQPQIVWQVKCIARMLGRQLGLASSTSFWSCAESCIDMYDYGYVRALS